MEEDVALAFVADVEEAVADVRSLQEATAGLAEVAEEAYGAYTEASAEAAAATFGLGDAAARLAEVQADSGASAEEVAEAQSVYSAALDRASGATVAAIDAQTRLAEAEGAAAEAAVTAGDAEGAAAEGVAAKNDVAGDSAVTMGAKYKMALLGIVVGLGLAVKSGMDFQQESTKWVTSAGESASQLGMLQRGVLSLSAQTATSSSQLADGLYMISSSGITGAGGLNVLRAAAEGAKSEGADLATVTNALTSGINAYGMKTQTSAEATASATSMMNQMLATVSVGKMTFQELASSLSSVLPIAAAHKLSYAQVGGALATMTSMGMSARQGTQDLAATIRSLGNPTSVATGEMAEFGISSTDVSSKLGQRGLTGTISYLSDAITSKMGKSGMVLVNSMNQSKAAAQDAQVMLDQLPKSIQGISKAYLDGSTSYTTWYNATKTLPLQAKTMADQFSAVAGKAHGFNQLLTSGAPAAQTYSAAMAKMLGGATGLNVGLMLTGTHAKTFADNVKDIASKADGASGQVSGFAEVTKETSFQLAKAGDSIKAAGTELGLTLLPAVNHILGPLSSFLAMVAGNKAASIALAVVVGGVLAGALGSKLAGALKDVKNGFTAAMDGAEWLAGKLGLVTTATEAQAVATDGAADAQETLDAAETANPIGLIIVAIVLLIAAVVLLIMHWRTVWHDVTTIADEAAHLVAAAFDVIIHAAEAVLSWVASHWRVILAWLVDPIGMAVMEIRTHTHQIAQVFDDLRHDVMAILDGARHDVAAVFDGIRHDISADIDYVVDFVERNWRLIATILATVLLGPVAGLIVFIATHWAEFTRLTAQLYDDVTGFFRRLPGEIMSFLAGLPGLMLTAGRNIIDGLIHGIESAASDIPGIMSGLAHDVESYFTDPLKIFSPSRVFFDHGRNTMLGYIQGVQSMTGQLRAAMAGVGGQVAAGGLPGVTTGAGSTAGTGHVTVNVQANIAPGAAAYNTPQFNQYLQSVVQEAILRWGISNPGTGFVLPGRAT